MELELEAAYWIKDYEWDDWKIAVWSDCYYEEGSWFDFGSELSVEGFVPYQIGPKIVPPSPEEELPFGFVCSTNYAEWSEGHYTTLVKPSKDTGYCKVPVYLHPPKFGGLTPYQIGPKAVFPTPDFCLYVQLPYTDPLYPGQWQTACGGIHNLPELKYQDSGYCMACGGKLIYQPGGPNA